MSALRPAPYDSLRRLIAVTDGAGATVRYGYDLAGNATAIGYPGAGTVTRQYNQDEALTAVTDWLGNTTHLAYDPNGNLVSIGYPNTVSETLSYDDSNRVIGISDAAGGTALLSATYTYNADNLLTAANSATVSYSPLHQVQKSQLSGSAMSYSYDGGGRPIEIEGTSTTALGYNTGSELTTSTVSGAVTSYGFDTEGERTAVTPPTGAATRLTYDQGGRLAGVSTTGLSAAYGSNGDGLRMSKQVNGTAERFTWGQSGTLPLLIEDGTTDFIDGPHGEPLEQVTAGSPTYFLHNWQGSTRGLVSSSGSQVAGYTYDSYGNLVSSSGSTSTALLFQGQCRDAETGFYYLRARYYDPTTAQFLTRDPMVATTMSPYGYTQGNPLNSSDPSGLDNNYYYSWDMGPARSGGPQATMWWLTHRADYEFPFTIHHLASSYTVHGPGAISDAGGTTSTLCAGNNYAISAAGGSQPIHVDFAGIQGNVAVLQFTALPGHVEGTGSTIRFSSWVSADGHQYFDVTGHDTYSYDGVPLGFPFGPIYGGVTHVADALTVQSMWNQLATNVNGGSYPDG